MNQLDAWASSLAASGAAPATIKTRLATMRALMIHAGVNDPFELTRMDVVSFLARPMAKWSRHTYWHGIAAWGKFCQEFDFVSVDLLQGVRRPTQPAPVARPIPDETIRALLDIPLSHRSAAYVRLALFGALRVHEVAQVKGDDFADGWLTVTGKGGVTDRIPVHPELEALRGKFPSREWWFPSGAGHVQPSAVSRSITAALRRVGCQASAHQLRDSAATLLQREGKDVRVTQRFLRHRNLASTMKYTAVSDQSLITAGEYLDWSTRGLRAG